MDLGGFYANADKVMLPTAHGLTSGRSSWSRMMNNVPLADKGKRGCHSQSGGQGTIGTIQSLATNLTHTQVFEDDHESCNFKLIAYQGFRV